MLASRKPSVLGKNQMITCPRNSAWKMSANTYRMRWGLSNSPTRKIWLLRLKRSMKVRCVRFLLAISRVRHQLNYSNRKTLRRSTTTCRAKMNKRSMAKMSQQLQLLTAASLSPRYVVRTKSLLPIWMSVRDVPASSFCGSVYGWSLSTGASFIDLLLRRRIRRMYIFFHFTFVKHLI